MAVAISVESRHRGTPSRLYHSRKDVPASNIVATTNCGMAPMHRDIAEAKLMALGAGAKLARQRFG